MRFAVMIRLRVLAAAVLLFALAAPAAMAEASEYRVVCDDTCLQGFAASFLDAVAQRQPARVPMAPGVRYTENGTPLAINDGLWANATGVRDDNRLVFTDPASGGVGLFAIVYENGLPSLLSARLKVTERELTEIEVSLVRRDEDDAAVDTFAVPHAIWDREEPPEQRLSRQALIDIADSYFEGITQGRGDITPFHEDCIRFENGGQVTGRTDEDAGAIQRMGCQEQFHTGMLVIVTTVSHRRYLVVDEARQVVWAIVNFDHRGDVDEVEMRTGGTYTAAPLFRRPFSFQIQEAFKIVDGGIRQIEATVLSVPYRMPPGWPAD